jgi:hypothetical protein
VKKHVMDNECSDKTKELIKSECMLELAPPGCHRINLLGGPVAEMGINIFKNHFLSILSGVDDSFPMHLWDKLLPQAEQPSTYSDRQIHPQVCQLMHIYLETLTTTGCP